MYTFDCYTGNEVLPRTDAFKRFYSCDWISSYESPGDNCLSTLLPCTSNDNCTGGTLCLDATCQLCPEDEIPGGVEGSGDAPCYYLNHPGDSTYSAYDCVSDHEAFISTGVGSDCIYFDETMAEQTESYCTVYVGEVECDAPEPCDQAVCYAQPIPASACTTSCGATGQQAFTYTCEEEQTGDLTSTGSLVDCGLGVNETFNCVAEPGALFEVGSFDIGPCNRFDCPGQVVCVEEFEGDGMCDWTDQADYEGFFQASGLLSVNNNLEACNWDGGDCCAYTCDQTDTVTLGPLGLRGLTCAWSGGGCQRVSSGIAASIKSETSFIDPYGLATIDPGVDCIDNNDGTFNCCADMILYDGDLSPLVTSSCTWGTGTYDNCATQGYHCLDPLAPYGNDTTTAP